MLDNDIKISTPNKIFGDKIKWVFWLTKKKRSKFLRNCAVSDHVIQDIGITWGVAPKYIHIYTCVCII